MRSAYDGRATRPSTTRHVDDESVDDESVDDEDEEPAEDGESRDAKEAYAPTSATCFCPSVSGLLRAAFAAAFSARAMSFSVG